MSRYIKAIRRARKADEQAYIELGELEDALPHGSGIDGEWRFKPVGETDLLVSNEYHVMNSTGMYIGWIYFEFNLTYIPNEDRWEMSGVRLDKDDVEALVEEVPDSFDYGNEEYYPWGESDADLLEEYLDDTIYASLKDRLPASIKNALPDDYTAKVARKSSRVGATADASELEGDDYYYAQGGSEAYDFASEAVGLEEIHGYTDSEILDATNAIVRMGNAEYDEIWLTWSSRWYEVGTEYELVYTSDALHDWISNKD